MPIPDKQALEQKLSKNTDLAENLLAGLPEEKLTDYYNRSTDARVTAIMNLIGPLVTTVMTICHILNSTSPSPSAPLSTVYIISGLIGLGLWGGGAHRWDKERSLRREISAEAANALTSPSPE
jgi:hypothetical protein